MPLQLKDLLPDAPREKNLLVAAAEADLAGMMREHITQGIDSGSAIRLAAASFGANTHFTEDACTWVATELAVALGLGGDLAGSRTELPAGEITTTAEPAAQAAAPAQAPQATRRPYPGGRGRSRGSARLPPAGLQRAVPGRRRLPAVGQQRQLVVDRQRADDLPRHRRAAEIMQNGNHLRAGLPIGLAGALLVLGSGIAELRRKR